jgi:hypothetical protein
MAAAVNSGVIIAVAAHQKMLLAEEEQMTKYTQEELGDDWEFKIVRSNSSTFKTPQALNKLIEEESRAGWIMLEKFDDNRVRFKRLRSARARDANLPEGIDPYRTTYGPSEAMIALTIVGVIALIFGIILVVRLLT